MASRTLSDSVKQFYHDLELDQRVYLRDQKVKDVQSGVEYIVLDILRRVEKQDARFKLNLVKTGSFYDEAKVGEPDEFDFVGEMATLSSCASDEIDFVKIPDPVFLQVKLMTTELKETWKEYLSSPYEMSQAKSKSMSHVDNTSPLQTQSDMTRTDLILDPRKVQKRFRQYVNKAFKDVKLPPGWEYGGCNKPNFGGVRWHGPATMLQLVYRTASDEYKVTVDLTIGIALPLPVRPEKIGMNVFPRIPNPCEMRENIKAVLKHGPNLHVIPLYSKLLVSKKKFMNKFSWRISCSGIEKHVFDKYPETSGVKICMRMIKAVRELFLAQDRRKTHREKKKKKMRSDGDPAGSRGGRGRGAMRGQRGSRRGRGISRDQRDMRVQEFDATSDSSATESGNSSNDSDSGASTLISEYITADEEMSSSDENPKEVDEEVAQKKESLAPREESLAQRYDSLAPLDESLATRDENLAPRDESLAPQDKMPTQQDESPAKQDERQTQQSHTKVALQPHNNLCLLHELSDTTDLTEMELESSHVSTRSKAEMDAKMRKYQLHDISEMAPPKRGTGEYWGPRMYMPSIEIKSFIFNMITLHPDESHWTPDRIYQYVVDFYAFYYGLIKSRHYIKHFFFNTMVSSPCSEDERLAAIKKFDQMLQAMNMVANGRIAYKEVKQIFGDINAEKTTFEQAFGKRCEASPLFTSIQETNVCKSINDFTHKNPLF